MSDQSSHLAHTLPPEIRFGTSSWTYPGWQGSVYKNDYKNEKDFKARCLEEYGAFPWFRTVGIDSSFYGPPRPSTLANYHALLPQEFSWVSKVWEEITIPVYPRHKRYGKKAGQRNPNFLNAELFKTNVLSQFEATAIRNRTAAFVFQFQSFSRSDFANQEPFLTQLDSFLSRIPKEFRYAIELRNEHLLTAEYLSVLNEHGATHCFNHWTRMPRLRTQMEKIASHGSLSAEFYVARLLTPIGVSYSEAVRRFTPYDTLVAANAEMRADTLILAKRAIQRRVPAFILVNNRSEGYAPQTIEEIGREIIAQTNES